MLASKSLRSAKKTATTRSARSPAAVPVHGGKTSHRNGPGVHHSNRPAISLRRAVQTKVTVGQAGDRYEREADNVADKVSSGGAAGEISRIPPGGLKAQTMTDAGDDDQAQTLTVQREAEGDDTVQEKCAGCEAEEQSSEASRPRHEISADDRVVQREEESGVSESEADAEPAAAGDENDPDAPDCETGDNSESDDDGDIESDEAEPGEETASGAEEGAEAVESEDAEEAGDGDSLGCGEESESDADEESPASPGAEGEQSCGGGAETAEVPQATETGAEGENEESQSDQEEAPPQVSIPDCAEPVTGNEGEAEEATSEESPGEEQGACAEDAQTMTDEGVQEMSVQREQDTDAQEGSDQEEAQELSLQREEEGDAQEACDQEEAQEMSLQREQEGDSVQEDSDQEDAQEMSLQREEEGDAQEACDQEEAQEMSLQREEEGDAQTEAEEGGGSGCADAEAEVAAQTSSEHPAREREKGEIAAEAIRSRDSGEPLSPMLKEKLESSLGVDLSSVRVHTGSAAIEANRAMKARAFTHRNHIWLGQGQSQSNTRLMAHEVTHTIQQGAVSQAGGAAGRAGAGKSGAIPTAANAVQNNDADSTEQNQTAQLDDAIDYSDTPLPTEAETRDFKYFTFSQAQQNNVYKAAEQILYLIFDREEDNKKRETKALIERTTSQAWRDFKDYVIDSGGIEGLLPVQKTYIKTEAEKTGKVKANIARIKSAASGDKQAEYSLREQALAVMQNWLNDPYYVYYALNFKMGLNWNIHGNPDEKFDKEAIDNLKVELASAGSGKGRAKALMAGFIYDAITEIVNRNNGQVSVEEIHELLKTQGEEEDGDGKEGDGDGSGEGNGGKARLEGEYTRKRLKSLTPKQKKLLKRLPAALRKSGDSDALVNLLDRLLAMPKEEQDSFIEELHNRAKLNKAEAKGKKGDENKGRKSEQKPADVDVDALEDEMAARKDIEEVLDEQADQQPGDQVDAAEEQAKRNNDLINFLKTLSAEERKAFLEFLSGLKQADQPADMKSPEEIFNAFKQLTAADMEALKLKKMLAEQEVDPAQQMDEEKQKRIRVAVQKAKTESEQAEVDAKDINEDMAFISSLLSDGDARKSLVPFDLDDFKVLPERMMLYGLMDGAGTQSTEIREAAEGLKTQIGSIQTELLKQIRDIAIEMGIHAGLSAIPVVGWIKAPATILRLTYLGHKINRLRKKLLALKRGYETFQNVRTTIENARSVINNAPGYVEKFEKARRNWETLQAQLDDLDSPDDIEERIEAAFDQLMEQFNDKIDVLEPLFEKMYLPDEVRDDPQALIKILFNLPKGIESFGDMIRSYNKNPATTDENELLVLYYKGMQSGAQLYPLVGFVIGALSEALEKAFESRFSAAGALDRFLGNRRKWGKRRKGGKSDTGGRLGSLWPRKMEYKGHNRKLDRTPQFDPYLKKAGAQLEDEIKAGKPPWKFRLRLYLRFWLRGFVKRLNKKGWKVKGRRKPKRKQKPVDFHDVPLPKFKYKLKQSAGKNQIRLRINPDYRKEIASLDYSYIKKNGLPLPDDFRKEEGRSLKKWLKKKGYELTSLRSIGWHIRRAGSKSVRNNPLRIKDKKLIAGLESSDSSALDDFIAARQTIVDNLQLPDGFHLRKSGIPSSRGRKAEKHILVKAPRTTPAYAMHIDGEGKLKKGRSSGKEEIVLSRPPNAITGPTSFENGLPKEAEGTVGYVVNKNRGSLSSIKVPGMRKNDDKGHVVAARFNGVDKSSNLVAMNRKLNQSGDWYQQESALAKAYKKAIGEAALVGEAVLARVKIVVHYFSDRKSSRPKGFDFAWWVHKKGKEVASKSHSDMKNKQ